MMIFSPLLQVSLDFTQEAEGVLPGVDSAAAGDPTVGFGNFLSTMLSAVMIIGALLVLLALIMGALQWISAGGDSSKIQKARDRITQAVIGLIVLSATLAIFNVLQLILGIQILNLPGTSGGQKGPQPNLGIPSQGTIRSPGSQSTNEDSNVGDSLDEIRDSLSQ